MDMTGKVECWSVVCAEDWMERKQSEMVGMRLALQVVLYSGANEQGRNGMRIVLSNELEDNLMIVSRKGDEHQARTRLLPVIGPTHHIHVRMLPAWVVQRRKGDLLADRWIKRLVRHRNVDCGRRDK